jgi:GNAT superfamily N-acetyltransferase
MVRIETATENDMPQILRMIREFAAFAKMSEFCDVTEERLREALFGERPCVEGLIAFNVADKAVGYALFFENYASFHGQRGLYLEDLYVTQGARGQKVGEMLMKRLAGIAIERGAERIDWLVLVDNAPAIKFYEKLGASIDPNERHFRILGENFEKLAE